MLGACRSPKMEEVSYSTTCPDSVNEAMRCLLAAPRLHTLELTPRNMTLTPENMHIIGALPSALHCAIVWSPVFPLSQPRVLAGTLPEGCQYQTCQTWAFACLLAPEG